MRHHFVIGCVAILASMSSCSATEIRQTRTAALPNPQSGQATLTRLKAEQRQLLLQVRREIAALPPLPEPSPDDSEALRSQRARQRQLTSLLEEIEARIKIDDSPRTLYAPSDKVDPGVREYYQRLQARIESAANDDLPKDSTGSIYGRVNISFTLNAQGQIESIEILWSTSEALVTYSKALLKRLEPFEPFPASIAKNIDHIVVSTPFNFLRTK
jgi:periplasmic protein TonB